MAETPRVEPSPKRVRVMHHGEVVADVDGPLLIWEIPYYPTYAFPRSALDAETLATLIVAGDARDVQGDDGALADHVVLRWDAMDHWFEEDEEVFVHARSPYHRIDVLPSSRRVEVVVDGEAVADSTAPRLLFETNLPVRYYLPKVDVRMDLLTDSGTVTGCPYKGTARYWNVRVGDTERSDLAWGYDFTTREASPVAGLVCFYNEHVDLIVDGVAVGRPDSPFAADKFA